MITARVAPPPVLGAALSGRTILIAVESVPRHARMANAIARVTGRDGDHVVVRCPTRCIPVTVRPWERRPATAPCSEWDGLPALDGQGGEPILDIREPSAAADLAASDAAWAGRVPGPGLRVASPLGPEAIEGPRSAPDGLPDIAPYLDPDDALGLIVAYDCLPLNVDTAKGFLWFALRLVQAAERAGTIPPLILGAPKRLRVLSRLLGWRILEYDGEGVCVPDRDPGALADPAVATAAFAGRLAEMRTRCPVDHADGVWRASGDGRTVLAIRNAPHPLPDGPGAEILVVTVDPGPRVDCSSALFKGDPGDATIHNLVADAWLSGPSHLDGADSTKFAPSPSHRMLMEMVTHPALANLRAALAGILGSEEYARDALVGLTKGRTSAVTWADMPGGDGRRRRQFLSSYPAFKRLAVDPLVTAAVDAGLSPVPRLGELLDMPAWAIRRVARERLLPLGEDDQTRVDWTYQGRVLAALGPDRTPRSGDPVAWHWLQWNVAHLRNWIHDAASHPREIARLAAGPDPVRWSAPRQSTDAIGGEVRDFLRSLSQWLADLTGRTDVPAAVVAAEYGSMAALLEACVAWHADRRLSGRSHRVPPDASWPVPFATVDLGGGWTAVAIPDAAGLSDEGAPGPDADGLEGLDHCVASYASDCLAGEIAIVSLRLDWLGRRRRMSTAEIDLGGGPHGLKVRQHKGRSNVRPPKAAEDALRRLIDGIDVGGFPVDPDAFGGPRRAAEANAVSAHDLLPAWRRALPKRVRDRDVAAWFARLRGAKP